MTATPTKVYVIMFTLVAVCYIGYAVMRSTNTTSEHFVTEEAYESRMHVISVFDGYLHRNPSPAEIEKYSAFKNEQDILTAVMQDNHMPQIANQPIIVKQEVVEEEAVMVEKEMFEQDENITIPKSLIKTMKERANALIDEIKTLTRYLDMVK
jgi:translation elongation factor EF-Ts